MNIKNFNLVTEPWIPVRYLEDGRNTLVGLQTLFEQAAAIEDLGCPPHERISLMRLLVCITQAELGAPPTGDDWEDFGDDLEARVPAYLNRGDVRPHFNLFGDGPRFLQSKVPSTSEPVSASKLVPHLATGNNPTLFDHEGGTTLREFSAPRLATALLAFQCFYPLYGAGYKGKGPCVDGNMVHAILQGDNLRETILLNCLTEEWITDYFSPHGMGRPIWELHQKDQASIVTTSYLGRLVPMHRSLWLLEDGSGFHLSKTSLSYPTFEEAREPTATVILVKKKDTEERRLLPARLDKSIWRDLHLLAVLRAGSRQEACAPLTIQSHAPDLDDDCPIWVGALVTDMKAKIHDTLESTFTLPAEMFKETGRRLYESGVEHAEAQSRQLYGAVRTYAQILKNESAPTAVAQNHYWNAVEQQVDILLGLVRDESSLEGKNFGEADDPWSRAVWLAARRAYESACPRLTPRQLQAYAAGLRVLKPKSRNKKPTPQPTTV